MLGQYHETVQALGGEVTIVVTAEHTFAAADFAQLWRVVYAFERRFSRFLPESELSQFNRNAGLDTPVSEQFAALLEVSQRLSMQTGGFYNPFVLPAVQRAGYVHSALAGYESDQTPDYRSRSITQANRLTLRDGKATIPYGTAIDMGGCGKGYLADVLARQLQAYSLPGFWVSLGGDMVTYGVDADQRPWRTGIQRARSNHPVPYEIVSDGQQFGIASSGTLRRANQRLKTGAHHIIDPRSGRPAQTDIRLATVVCETAVQADVLASCAVIAGSSHAPKFLREQGVKSYVLQTTTGVMHEGGLLQLVAQTAGAVA